MNRITLPFRMAWRLWFMLVFLISFLLMYPFFLVFLSRKAWFPVAFFFKRVVAGITCVLSGVFYRLIKTTDTDWSRTYVIISNHSSYLDIVISYLFIPIYYHFMGKNELGKVPLFKIFFKRMNILVDRASKKSSHEAYLRACNDIDKGTSIYLFPEATIPDDTPRLRRFKNGAARLAIACQVPVLPITFLDNWRIFPEGKNAKKGGRPGIARIVIHEPIETRGMTEDDIRILNEQLYRITEETLQEYGVIKETI